MTTETRPPRVGVAVATSTSWEASCTPVSTTSSSHCMSPSMSWWSPAAGRAAAPGCRTPSWSAWPWPRCCSAITPNAAGCGRSMAGWGTCSPTCVGRRPTTAGCAARPPGRPDPGCLGGGLPVVVRPVAAAGRDPGPLRHLAGDGQAQRAGWLGRLRLGRQPSPLLLGPQAVGAGRSRRHAGCLVPGQPQRRRAGGRRGAVGPRRPPGVLCPGMVTLADKGLAGREFQALVDELGATLARPDRADEPYRFGNLGGVRQWIEAIFDTSKTSSAWNATAPTPSTASGSGSLSGCWPWPLGSGSTGNSMPRSSARWSLTTIEPTNQSTSVI